MDDLLIALTCVVPLVVYLLWTKGQGPNKATYACVGLGLAFCYFALGHFVVTDELAQMLPPQVPQRGLIIHVTGCLEVLIAVGLFTERWRGLAATAAAFVLIAFFPANIYAAVRCSSTCRSGVTSMDRGNVVSACGRRVRGGAAGARQLFARRAAT